VQPNNQIIGLNASALKLAKQKSPDSQISGQTSTFGWLVLNNYNKSIQNHVRNPAKISPSDGNQV
jgi:hypothetical protein